MTTQTDALGVGISQIKGLCHSHGLLGRILAAKTLPHVLSQRGGTLTEAGIARSLARVAPRAPTGTE